MATRAPRTPQDLSIANRITYLQLCEIGINRIRESIRFYFRSDVDFAGRKQRETTIPQQGKIRRPEALERLVQLYTNWYAAEPNLGYDAKAAEWQKKRDDIKAAPTAVPTVNYTLVIVGTTTNFNGSGSTDPEMDAISYLWEITTAPLGSTAQLVGANTATPSLITDAEGTYEVTLTVSDFLGPGSPVSVEFVATTPANFAEIKIVQACDLVGELQPWQVTTRGNQIAFCNFLKNATKDLHKGKISQAIDKINQARERTDGCALRGSPDGNGQGMDWIADCDAQFEIYNSLTQAIEALQ